MTLGADAVETDGGEWQGRTGRGLERWSGLRSRERRIVPRGGRLAVGRARFLRLDNRFGNRLLLGGTGGGGGTGLVDDGVDFGVVGGGRRERGIVPRGGRLAVGRARFLRLDNWFGNRLLLGGTGGGGGTGLVDDGVDFGVVGGGKLELPEEGSLHMASELEPLVSRSGFKVAKGTYSPLSRTARSADGLDEEVVGIGLPLTGVSRASDEHENYIHTIICEIKKKVSMCSHYN
jgi:hypothetical protein